MASTYLTRAFSSSTSTTKATWSFWVKFSAVNTGVSGTGSMLFQARNSASSNNFRTYIRYEENGTLDFICYNATGTKIGEYYTSRVFRDSNAWYHICYSLDTTLNTASDRLKLYVNGVRETSFYSGSYTEIGQNETVKTTSSVFTDISRNGGTAGYYFNGILSHYILTDGYSYAPTAFGEYDANGVWTIKTEPSVTYGTNGFFILKDGNSVTDQSGNSNNFTVGGGTLTKTEDSPSNVFCTLNPLARGDLTNNATLSNGNTYYSSDQGGYNIRVGTIGAHKGKFYWEGKFISHNPQTSPGMPLGIIADNVPIGTNIASGQAPYYYAYSYDGGSNGTVIYNSNETNYGTTLLDTVGQIGMVALDLDNNKVYFGVNGTWTNSANPANGTNGYSIIDPADTPLGFYLPATADRSSIREYVYAWNFGNGYFGTTAVSSAGTNASGIGIFEYDVPTGYTALSTKGLNL